MDELSQAVLKGDIKFTMEYQVSDVYTVSVQTHYDKFTKKVDMQYANAVMGDVLKVAPEGAIVGVESMVSPGSIDRYVRSYVTEKGCSTVITIATCLILKKRVSEANEGY